MYPTVTFVACGITMIKSPIDDVSNRFKSSMRVSGETGNFSSTEAMLVDREEDEGIKLLVAWIYYSLREEKTKQRN